MDPARLDDRRDQVIEKRRAALRAARRKGHFCYWPVPLAAA